MLLNGVKCHLRLEKPRISLETVMTLRALGGTVLARQMASVCGLWVRKPRDGSKRPLLSEMEHKDVLPERGFEGDLA
jgi:hypothetical protein